MKLYLYFIRHVLRHKWFVVLAGIKTSVPFWRLIIHDLSKFSSSEFGQYARNYQGDYSKSPVNRKSVPQEVTFAWLHHENSNPHHWGYWIPRTGKSANTPLPMPEIYVREMIADCMGAGRAYTGSWDIAEYLNENGPAWKLHEFTLDHIWQVMTKLGYVITDNCDWSWVMHRRSTLL